MARNVSNPWWNPGFTVRFGLLVLLISAIHVKVAVGKIEPGFMYALQSLIDGYCLKANGYDFHTDIGVFLGQVSTDPCDEADKAQKWGVILWSTEESTKQLWLYPRKNGLNSITAIPYPEEPLPEKNLVEIIPYENTNEDAFLIKSIELNQCVLSRGKENAIAYEPCNAKIKAQLWLANVTQDETYEKSITGRGVFGTVKDFVVYHGTRLISTIRGSSNSRRS